MAILEGGIFSNPRGKTGGIVFGAARTRQGKKVTSRLLVPPSNPNTAAQQTQRSKFAEALAIVRLIGPNFYQGDFNRSIGQLPGFQSLTSIYLNSMNASADIGTIPSINLGSLHKPAIISYAGGTPAGSVTTTWSTELGINGTTLDLSVLFYIGKIKGSSPLERQVQAVGGSPREDGDNEQTGFTPGTVITALWYFRGAGTADGLLSPTDFGEATATP